MEAPCCDPITITMCVSTLTGMDAFKPYEDANQEASFIMSKAVLMTCLVALIYISLVIALMLWCRHRKNKSRANANGEDMEKRGEGENDDTASDGDENKVRNSISSSDCRRA